MAKIFPYGWKKSDMVGKLLRMEGGKFRYGWKKSDMVGKLLRMEGGKFRYGWKKSDMVGKLLRIQGGNDWKYSHMVGKSLTWSENYSGWKATNSNMVGNFPQGVRKDVPSHRTFSLFHPSYRREFPILFSISVATLSPYTAHVSDSLSLPTLYLLPFPKLPCLCYPPPARLSLYPTPGIPCLCYSIYGYLISATPTPIYLVPATLSLVALWKNIWSWLCD